MNTPLKARMQCVCVMEVGEELEPPKSVKLFVQRPVPPTWCSCLPQLAPCYKQVATFTFYSTKSGARCRTYTSIPLSMKVSSMQSAHARFPSGLVKVSVKRRRRGKIVVFIPLKDFLDDMNMEDDEADKLVLYVSCNDSRIERTRDLPHPGGSSTRKEGEAGKMRESVKENTLSDTDEGLYQEKATQGKIREYNEHIEGPNCQCFKYKSRIESTTTSRDDLEAEGDETVNTTLEYSRYTTTLKSTMICTCVMEVGEDQHEPPRMVTLSVQTPAPAWCCGLPITYFKQFAKFTFDNNEHVTSRQNYTSVPLILKVYRLKRAHSWSPSALVKVSIKQKRGGKIEFFTPVHYFLNHMETNDAKADELVLYVSSKNARMERTRWEQQEVTVEQDLYENEAEKDEVRNTECEAKDEPVVAFTLNPEETVLRTRMQVLEMSQRTTYAEGKYIRSTLDDLMAEMNLLEKEMDCAETLWAEEEEGEGGFTYEGTHQQNVDDDQFNELMENCTQEEMQDVFSGINWNLFEEDEDEKEQGRTNEGSHIPQPVNTCIKQEEGTTLGSHVPQPLNPYIVQDGTVKGLAKLALFLLVVMCLAPVAEHPYLPFRLDLPGLK